MALSSPAAVGPPHPPHRPAASAGSARWGVPVRLGERRVLRRGRWLWLRAVAWLLLLFFLTAAAFGLPLQATVDLLPPGNAALHLAGLLLASATMFGCYALAVRAGEERTAAELALRPAVPEFVVGSVLGLVMMTLLVGVLVVTGLYDITLIGATPAWTGLGLALQAAVTEELWMRALLLRLLWRAFGPVPAFIVSAAVFGALHLANPGATVLAGATVVAAGLMFCSLYALTGRIWVPLGVHLAWNFTQGYLFGAVVSGNSLGGSVFLSTARPGAAGFLTGGAFGPEASVFALALVSSVTVGALKLARRTGRFTVCPGRVPIVGASGGIGLFAVQLAKAFGAEVSGVCSGAKVDLVHSVGADRVIDYTVEDVTATAQAYDLILDLGGTGPLSALRPALTPRGTLVLVGGEGGGRWIGGAITRSLGALMLSPFAGQHLRMIFATARTADLGHLSRLIDDGLVAPVMDRSFGLHEAVHAVRYLTSGHAQGKVVLNV